MCGYMLSTQAHILTNLQQQLSNLGVHFNGQFSRYLCIHLALSRVHFNSQLSRYLCIHLALSQIMYRLPRLECHRMWDVNNKCLEMGAANLLTLFSLLSATGMKCIHIVYSTVVCCRNHTHQLHTKSNPAAILLLVWQTWGDLTTLFFHFIDAGVSRGVKSRCCGGRS